jgi:transposase-like protein
LEFLRRCPSCGRRFAVKVDRRVLEDRQEDNMELVHNVVVGGIGFTGPRYSALAPVVIRTVENVPIERDTFSIQYECRHCHHQWSERVTVAKKR